MTERPTPTKGDKPKPTLPRLDYPGIWVVKRPNPGGDT
jgi:hypothetical protein